MRFQHAILMMSAIIGIFSLVDCGGSKAPTATPSPTAVSVQDILNSTADRFDQTNSLHFDLTVDGDVALDQNGTIKLHSANGDLKRPDSAQAKANVTFLGANLSINLVSIGSDEYMTNPISGSWEKAPSDLGYDPAVLFDKDQGISHVIRTMQNPQMSGTDTVNGKDAYHITGTVKKSDAQPIAGGALKSDTLPVDLWVDKQTNDVVKLVLHDSSGSGGNSETTWTLLLTKQNESVTINKPNV